MAKNPLVRNRSFLYVPEPMICHAFLELADNQGSYRRMELPLWKCSLYREGLSKFTVLEHPGTQTTACLHYCAVKCPVNTMGSAQKKYSNNPTVLTRWRAFQELESYERCTLTGFPLFRTDKIQWYFHDFSRFFSKFPGIFFIIFKVRFPSGFEYINMQTYWVTFEQKINHFNYTPN